MIARNVKANETIPSATPAAQRPGSSGIALAPPPPLPVMAEEAPLPETEKQVPPQPWHITQRKPAGRALPSTPTIQLISDFSKWLLQNVFEPVITEIENNDEKPLPELLANRKEILNGIYGKDDTGQPASASAIAALRLFLEKMETTPSNIVLGVIIIDKLTKAIKEQEQEQERWKTETAEVTRYLNTLHGGLLTALPDVSDEDLSGEESIEALSGNEDDLEEQAPAGPMDAEDARFLQDHMRKFYADYEFPSEEIFQKAYKIIVAKYAEWADVEADRGDIIEAAIKQAEKGEASEPDGSDEESEDIELPDTTKWEDSTVAAKLELFGKEWWAKVRTGAYYRIFNTEGLESKLKHGINVDIKRPFKDYKGVSTDAKDAIEAVGAVLVNVGKEPVNAPLPTDKEQALLAAQIAALREEHAKQQAPKGARNRYLPGYVDEDDKYAIKWEGALTVKGKTASRVMTSSMDIRYKTSEGNVHIVPGESFHYNKLFSADPLKGNEVYISFRLLYLDGESIKLTNNQIRNYGSGKTEIDRNVKHERADLIATMLTDSGQIGSVAEYNDEDHSHSEQWMIVKLSNDLGVFDSQLEALARIKRKISIQAFLIDMFSSPNTICDNCHPSLEKFFAGSNWKELVTSRLKGRNTNRLLTFDSPEIILRVSANKSFSASATGAISKAKKTITIEKGQADVHFVERTPYNRSLFK